jgi:ribosomal protein S2
LLATSEICLGGSVINDSGLYHRLWVGSALTNLQPFQPAVGRLEQAKKTGNREKREQTLKEAGNREKREPLKKGERGKQDYNYSYRLSSQRKIEL